VVNKTIDERVLEKMIELYVSYRGRYILCLPTGNIITPKRKDGKYSWLSNAVLRNHLEQQYAVGVFADNYGSRFICFDVDNGNADTVHAIIDELAALGFSRSDIHVSFSGGKGYHVEVFFDECIITYRLQALYSHVITARGLDPQKVEFRPMNTASIKLPLSRHAKTGKICWFVDRDTLVPIMRQDYVLSIHQIRAAEVKALIPECPVITPRSQETKIHSEKGCSSPETRDLGTTLEQVGTRHNMMRNIAVFKRTHGASREECETALHEWIEAQDSQYYKSSQRDIRRDIDELIAWVYSERFVLQKAASVDSTVLRTSMLEGLLAQNTRTARRLYFLFLVRCRMQQPRMSLKDAGKAIGASVPTVVKGIRALTEGQHIEVVEGKRLSLGNGVFTAECRSYVVPHSGGNRDELCITITMRELIFDFNACYHKVLHA